MFIQKINEEANDHVLKEIELAEQDPDVGLEEVATNVYYDTQNRKIFITQIISEESFMRSLSFQNLKSTDAGCFMIQTYIDITNFNLLKCYP